MSDFEQRIKNLERQLVKAQNEIAHRHQFSMQVFSCVIDLWGLIAQIYDRMPAGPETKKFKQAIDELRTSIIEAQATSNEIVADLED